MMNPESRLDAKKGFENLKNHSKPQSLLRMEQARVEKLLAQTGSPHANPPGLQDLKQAVNDFDPQPKTVLKQIPKKDQTEEE